LTVLIVSRLPPAIFPLIGLVAAIFILLSEVYGFEQDSEQSRPGAPLEPA
jgi:hypothetical protein